MVHLQIIARGDQDVVQELRDAIAQERIRSFEVTRVRGGVRLGHKAHPGELRLSRTEGGGPLLVTVRSRPESKEWQLLSAFIGRLADHFKDQISSINIQLEPSEVAPKKPKKKRSKQRLKRPRQRPKRKRARKKHR
jgi:hypothetical protein